MIRNIKPLSNNIKAGEDIILMIQAKYPVNIVIKCFVSQPPPAKFVPCPDSGEHTLEREEYFKFSTSKNTFTKNGYIEFTITDSDFDTRTIKIKVNGNENERTMFA